MSSVTKDIDAWNMIAVQYSAWLQGGGGIEGEAFTKIVTEGVLKVLGPVNDKTILDLGCGEGQFARRLAKHGAIVSAIDGAPSMIEIARNNTDNLSIEYALGDITQKLPYESSVFDFVVCNMVLMDVEDIFGLTTEVARVLKIGGKYVFSLVHPCFFEALGEWIYTDTSSPALRFKKRYTEQFTYQKKLAGLATDVSVAHYHRPIQYYVQALIRNQLCIADFVETSFSREYLNSKGILEDMRTYHLTANNLIIAAEK